jgi:hypothetical protein
MNQSSPLDRLIPALQKKKQKKKLSNKQGTEKEHTAEGSGFIECTRVRGSSKELISVGTFSKQSLERQMGRQWMGDKPLPETGQTEVHKAHLLNQ